MFYAFINLFDERVRSGLGTHEEFEVFCKEDCRILNDGKDGYSSISWKCFFDILKQREALFRRCQRKVEYFPLKSIYCKNEGTLTY